MSVHRTPFYLGCSRHTWTTFFVVALVLLFGGPSLLAQTNGAANGDSEDIQELTFDNIKFDMKPGAKFSRSMLTDDIVSLDKKRIRLRGYIRPSTEKKLSKFVFVRDNKECCFGPGAAIFDCVLVELSKGTSTKYTVRPVTIEGDFFLKEFKGPDGKVWAIYRMKNGELN